MIDPRELIKDKKVLHLTLKRKWFEMIASGEKKEEYREQKPYWRTRLENPHPAIFVWDFKDFDYIVFRNGYSTDSPILIVEHIGTDYGESRPEWADGKEEDCYVICLGKVIYNSITGKELTIKEE